MEFVKIPAGSFIMGSSIRTDEGPQHKVIISKPFCLGKYQVTQQQWIDVMGYNPSYFIGSNNPVENVSWNDVQEFISKYNKKNEHNVRLPSEAEWEYACRAGTDTRYHFGDDPSKLSQYAWYEENSNNKLHPVGQLKPNRWELYDMYGNIGEWVQDRWHNNYKGAPNDGSAWEIGNSVTRCNRGSGYKDTANKLYSDIRNLEHQEKTIFNLKRDKKLGFRLVKY